MKLSEAPISQMLQFDEDCEYQGVSLPAGIEGYKSGFGDFIVVGCDDYDNAYLLTGADPEVSICTAFCRDTVVCRVPIAEDQWADQPVDKCLAPLVNALNDLGIHTGSCCCGHGMYVGSILLSDNTNITIPRCKGRQCPNQ